MFLQAGHQQLMTASCSALEPTTSLQTGIQWVCQGHVPSLRTCAAPLQDVAPGPGHAKGGSTEFHSRKPCSGVPTALGAAEAAKDTTLINLNSCHPHPAGATHTMC